jgi:hypothetical protein
MVLTVAVDAAPDVSTLVRDDQAGRPRAPLGFRERLLHGRGGGMLHRHQRDQAHVIVSQAAIRPFAQANAHDREAFHGPDLDRVVDQVGPIVGSFQGPPQRIQPQTHQPASHRRP